MVRTDSFTVRYKDFVKDYDPEYYEVIRNVVFVNVFPGTDPDVTEEQIFKELVRVGRRLKGVDPIDFDELDGDLDD